MDSPVAATTDLLDALEKADELLQEANGAGAWARLWGKNKQALDQAKSSVAAAARSHDGLHRSIREERQSGMVDASVQERNRELVHQIESGSEEKSLRLLTLGLIGDRLKQAEYLEPARERLQPSERELLDMHRKAHESWERCKHLRDGLPREFAPLDTLINRLHTICIFVEDSLPPESSRRLGKNRHAV